MPEYNRDKAASKSIRTRLVGNFLIIIFISVLTFEGLLIYFTRLYFYGNVENILTNELKSSTDFYTQYFSNVSLEVNIIDNADIFWRQTRAQVQIVQNDGTVLLDSEGLKSEQKIQTGDVTAAAGGERGKWTGYVSGGAGKIHVMSVACPIKANSQQVGILRFITSLTDIDKMIFNITIIFVCIGVAVIVLAVIISLVLAHSVIHPLRKLTSAARSMAEGNLDERIEKYRNDEIGVLSETLNYMVSEVQNRENVKNDFISKVSHELRTPLTSIKGWANTIIDDDYTDREIMQDGLGIIIKESDRLTNMVDELLDFSRYVSGKAELNIEKTDVVELVEAVQKQMAGNAKKEKINFTTECESLLEGELDKNKIKQVLINLLGNSLKFTRPGGNVLLKAFYDKEDIIFRVEDDGCGISSEELPLVKEKFYKGKNSKSQTGLGLSICDEIVHLHKGKLTIESMQGQGTVVIVRIPRFNI